MSFDREEEFIVDWLLESRDDDGIGEGKVGTPGASSVELLSVEFAAFIGLVGDVRPLEALPDMRGKPDGEAMESRDEAFADTREGAEGSMAEVIAERLFARLAPLRVKLTRGPLVGEGGNTEDAGLGTRSESELTAKRDGEAAEEGE